MNVVTTYFSTYKHFFNKQTFEENIIKKGFIGFSLFYLQNMVFLCLAGFKNLKKSDRKSID